MWDEMLVEASGRITEATIGQYAASGGNAIFVGALTHSARALLTTAPTVKDYQVVISALSPSNQGR